MRNFAPILGLTVLAVAGPALADKKQPADPPAATWNDPPPPGVETVQPITPTWCAGHKPRPWLPGNLVHDDVSRFGYSEQLLTQIAELACDRPEDSGRQAWIAFYRQGWLNIVGTTEQEDRDAMAARLALKQQAGLTSPVCQRLWNHDDKPPAERVFDDLRAQAIGCSGTPPQVRYGTDGGDGMATASYHIDRAAEPPDELIRLAFVLRCFNPGTSSIDPKTAHRALGGWAFCGHDARKLDRAAFDRAIDGMKLPLLGRVRAREMFAYTVKLLASQDAAFAALRGKDKAYARLLDVPDAGFAAWVTLRAANQAALDDALAMEDKFRDGDKHAVAGCGVALRKQLKDHVAGRGPKTKDDVIDAVNDDVGQPLLKALIACDSLEGRHALVDTEMKLLGQGRTRRGPRTAAFWSTMDVVSEIVVDKTKFPVQPGNFGAPLPRLQMDDDWIHTAYEATFNQASWDLDQKGRVAAVKRKGDGVMVSFKTESWKEPILDCVETNRVDRISADGRVEYRQRCTAKGMETVKSTPSQAWIRNDLADGIKPGVVLEMRRDTKPNPAEGFPMEVYADQAKKQLVQYWGFPVKR